MKKLLPLILSTLLLTSCSGPDSSGGVEFSKTANAFPYGDCRGSGYQTHSTERTGCGWFTFYEINYFIGPHALDMFRQYLGGANLGGAYLKDTNLSYTNLSNADLSGATLSGAWLRTATLTGVKANSSTICPNGKNWGTSGKDCGF